MKDHGPARFDPMDETEQDFLITVTVRLYGGGTAAEVAQALRDYPGSFDLTGGREAEIIQAGPALE